MTFRLLYLICFAMFASSSVAWGDIPPLPAAELRRAASHVCVGTVMATNPIVTRSENWEKTTHTVEIFVTSALKGPNLKPLERVSVDCDSQRWIGPMEIEKMPTGWNGISAPPVGTRVLAYLRGDKSEGFRFVEPNGVAGIQWLREFPHRLNEHLSTEEWASVEKNLENAPQVRKPSPMKYYVGIAVFVILLVLIGVFRKRGKANEADGEE